MRPLLLVVALATACASSPETRPNFDTDARSGPDAKRSGALVLKPNQPHTDEVSFTGQDKTDWYVIELKGHAGVLQSEVHWDNDASDVLIDVFDAFGAQLAASPVREKGAKEKRLLTQIDKPGTYYLRITAPNRGDQTVYTLMAKWDAPAERVLPMGEIAEPEPERRHRSAPPREPRERPSGESVQGRIVAAYRDGSGLVLHLDKGASAGLKEGMAGTVLSGPSGDDALDGGAFRITKVLDDNKSVARSSLHSIGKNTRVSITLAR
jgi:hypothetical protein